jgi:L-fuculose-phosphate aldolase
MAAFIENAPEQVLAAAKELLEKGLVEGTSGNISARMEDGNVACTPSSLDYRIMTLEDIVVVNPEGETVSGTQSPTSEKYLHLACLAAYDDIAVVIHSHAVYATMFAVAHQDIPSCIDEFTVYLGMVAVATTMQKAMHNTALVERSAKIIWGAKQLGAIHPLPEKINSRFAGVYPYMR